MKLLIDLMVLFIGPGFHIDPSDPPELTHILLDGFVRNTRPRVGHKLEQTKHVLHNIMQKEWRVIGDLCIKFPNEASATAMHTEAVLRKFTIAYFDLDGYPLIA